MDPVSSIVENARLEIAAIAQTMLTGETELLSGCRRIVALRPRLPESEAMEPSVLTLVAVESELDDMPDTSERPTWAREALLQKDRQRDEYLNAAREAIEGACRELSRRYAQKSE